MAKKISQLTQATEVKSDDVTVIVQDGETKKLPLNMMVTKQDIENKKVAGLAKLDEIEATYENDTYTPTITVKNKSSVKVGEGDEVDYSANVMDGHAKSAILKGQTLVNHFDFSEWGEQERITLVADGTSKRISLGKSSSIKANTKYLTIIPIYENTINHNFSMGGWDYYKNQPIITVNDGTGIIKKIETTRETSDRFQNGAYMELWRENTSGQITFGKPMLIEYQDGMENWDIPYFTGMQSVKMPVLKTTGKNLFDKNTMKTSWWVHADGVKKDGGSTKYSIIVPITENKIYSVSCSKEPTRSYYAFLDKDYNTLLINGNSYTTTTSPHGSRYLLYYLNNTDLELCGDIQLEEGSTATSYEPYKSNILRTPSDLELGEIGDVQDTLNCLTGEVTERIGEIVLDGSESWFPAGCRKTNTIVFYSTITKASAKKFDDRNAGGKVNCDKFSWSSVDLGNSMTNDIEGIYTAWDGNICIAIAKSKLTGDDTNGFKQYLQSNPTTVQYILETPIVKTVDLMPSGTHPSTTPYCWKNGHIQLSSSGLLPNLEYSVVTSRAGQINQNATMIVKNDKRIFDLEILLAGGLVNTTYQALTLQNQVETGLSKVSLNSETEPDYLLYHMIMKLIEEKAYKLDDLTEKVSVFYLYEKLSDEQFETIYSALYPFVEDEIVEEPVVEELPEVVEDEVIM